MNNEVKNYLNVTWNDTETDAKITGIITRATAILADLAGVKNIDFEKSPSEKQLFLDLCRYIYNNAYEDFLINFEGQINGLRSKYAVAYFEQQQEEASESD